MTITPAIILAAVFVGAVASCTFAKAEPSGKPEKAKVEIGAKKIKAQGKNGKSSREFPLMFDIAERAKKAKAVKKNAAKADKEKVSDK